MKNSAHTGAGAECVLRHNEEHCGRRRYRSHATAGDRVEASGCGRRALSYCPVDLRRERLAVVARMGGQAAMPVGALRALEARRMFRARGYTDVTLKTALRAWMARVHLLPADVDLRRGLVVDIGANEGA